MSASPWWWERFARTGCPRSGKILAPREDSVGLQYNEQSRRNTVAQFTNANGECRADRHAQNQPQARCWASLSIPKSPRSGQGVAVAGVNLDLLAGSDVFLATRDQSFPSRDSGSYDGLSANLVARGH